MLKKTEISSASAILDDTTVAMLVTLIRNSAKYKLNPPYYATVQEKLEDADGSIQAKQLNAILSKIEKLGIGEVEISGGDEGIRYSKTREREALVSYAMSILYTEPFSSISVDPDATVLGSYGIGQRKTELD